MSGERFGADELNMIRGAVTAWLTAQQAGTPDTDNLNLAGYAAEILPKMCDKIAELRDAATYHQRQHAALSRTLHAIQNSPS